MLPGQMMNMPLTITSIMEFAQSVYGGSEIVSVTGDNPEHRYTYAEAFRRTRQLGSALAAAGVKPGDRIATLAWNDYRHFDWYYAISCSGAVRHTINPSLQRVVVGGAACPLSIMEEFAEKHDVYTHHAWGMTETGPLGVYNSLKPGMADLPKEELNAIQLKQGRPVFGVDMRIVDDAGNVQPWDGESVGEVRVRGNWICSGYYGIDTPGAHDEEGYFGTGDVSSLSDTFRLANAQLETIDLRVAFFGHNLPMRSLQSPFRQ